MEKFPKIAQQRLEAVAVGAHPDPDLLTAFAEKLLSERERAQILQHLGQCSDCREVVSLALPEIFIPSIPPAKPSRLSWTVLRWGAAAACVVVVTAAVTLHYERRENSEISVADKALETQTGSPAASTSTATQAREEMAKAAPRPANKERDFNASDKLAKQRDDQFKSQAPNQPAIGGFAASRRQSDSPSTAGAAAGLSDNRVAKADRLESLDEAESSVAAPASVVPMAPQSKAAGALARNVSPNESSYDSAKNETLNSNARSIQAETAQVGESRVKDKADKKSQKTNPEALQQLPKAARSVHLIWTLSADETLQRSFDSGKTWQAVLVAGGRVRAFSANDSDIWVGGAAGALFHSSDAGEHWTQVSPTTNGRALTADITHIEFTDAQHGSIITSSDETWSTSDSGVTWQRQ